MYLHLDEVKCSSNFSGNNQDNVSELLENFPSITACMWTDNSSINRNDVSVHNENTRLREILEKERYRRKVISIVYIGVSRVDNIFF